MADMIIARRTGVDTIFPVRSLKLDSLNGFAPLLVTASSMSLIRLMGNPCSHQLSRPNTSLGSRCGFPSSKIMHNWFGRQVLAMASFSSPRLETRVRPKVGRKSRKVFPCLYEHAEGQGMLLLVCERLEPTGICQRRRGPNSSPFYAMALRDLYRFVHIVSTVTSALGLFLEAFQFVSDVFIVVE